MAIFAATDYVITLNAVNMSTMITAVSLDVEADTLDITAFGATSAFRTFIAGLKKGDFPAIFNDDFAASQADALLWPLLGTVITFDIRSTSAAVSATNPRYTGSVLVSKLQPISAKIGDLVTVSVSWPTTGAVLRQTT